jgi:hypothetical protein
MRPDPHHPSPPYAGLSCLRKSLRARWKRRCGEMADGLKIAILAFFRVFSCLLATHGSLGKYELAMDWNW